MMKLMMFSHWPTFLIFEKKQQFELYISVRIQYKPYQIFECRNQTSFLRPPSERSSGKGKKHMYYCFLRSKFNRKKKRSFHGDIVLNIKFFFKESCVYPVPIDERCLAHILVSTVHTEACHLSPIDA